MYKLPKEIRDGILAYLQKRPYQEVAGGIQMLESLEEIKVAEPAVKSNETDGK